MRRDLLVGEECVRDAEEGEIRRRFAGRIRFHDRPGRAALHRLLDKFVSIEIFSAQRDEEVARLGRARVGTQVGDELSAPTILSDGPGELRNLVDRERAHARSTGILPVGQPGVSPGE